MEDARSANPVERLLEDSWHTRSRVVNRRELAVESAAGALFLCCAAPMAAIDLASHSVNLPLAALLLVLYAFASRIVEFPLGAGYVVPSYVALVPMLLLLPPGLAPLLAAAGLVLGGLAQAATGRIGLGRALLAVPDAWHAIGPAAVLMLVAPRPQGAGLALLYMAAFLAGCLLDLASATVRESAILGIGSRAQFRVIATVWLIDACFAPLGLLVAHAMRENTAAVLAILPVGAVLMMASRDRSARIAQAQSRLDLLAHERARLQTAVGRFGDALAAKLDLKALIDVVLRGSIEALDADSGRVGLRGGIAPLTIELGGRIDAGPALRAASESVANHGRTCQLARDGVWALALPFGSTAGGALHGAIAVARCDRPFLEDEQAVIEGLVEHAGQAAGDILAHERLREQARTDALTGLGNRRELLTNLDLGLKIATEQAPLALILLDLDGFKHYNDTFGHPAGDELLRMLSRRLERAAEPHGTAYRLGGDEFCVLLSANRAAIDASLLLVTGALEESGEQFAIGASHGTVLLPSEANGIDDAMRLADKRMYSLKQGRSREDSRTPTATDPRRSTRR